MTKLVNLFSVRAPSFTSIYTRWVEIFFEVAYSFKLLCMISLWSTCTRPDLYQTGRNFHPNYTLGRKTSGTTGLTWFSSWTYKQGIMQSWCFEKMMWFWDGLYLRYFCELLCGSLIRESTFSQRVTVHKDKKSPS